MIFCIQALFRHLPRQRALRPDMKNIADGLVKIRVNKKLLQEKLPVEIGNIVTLKDISNIAARIKSGEKQTDLESTINTLQNNYDQRRC